MFRFDDETFRARVLNHVAPRLVGTVVGTADGAVHVSGFATMRARDTPGSPRSQIGKTRLSVLAPHLTASG